MAADRQTLERVAKLIAPERSTVEHLGTGGFGSTFKVALENDVYALKLVDPGVSDESRVERELDAMQRVQHPGVVNFRKFGNFSHNDTEYKWIEMDFISGHTLRQSLDGGQVFTPKETAILLQKLVDGAGAIWQAGTAHRDLSPGNIMLTSNNEPVIVDLGLARHVDDETLTILPTPGTPGWMSPEQVNSTSHGDWRSDQFVIGAIAYRLLTGVSPFYASNFHECWMGPADKQPASIKSINADVPSSLCSIVEKMLSKQPYKRYLQLSELLQEIETAKNSITEKSDDDGQKLFLVNIGHTKNWTENGYLETLNPAGAIIDMQAGRRVDEFADVLRTTSSKVILDPATHNSRSNQAHTPAGYKKLPYGNTVIQSPFTDDESRQAWCDKVWDSQISHDPDIVISPYFYAGEGEIAWVKETLACGRNFNDRISESSPKVWTGVLTHASWLSNENAREELLNELTGQTIDTLHLLTHTNQASFAPLADGAVLSGLVELVEVMNNAGVSVIAGKRATSGLLLLALGFDGWSLGVNANLMNGQPHKESDSEGRPGTPRIYIPRLLNFMTVPYYVLCAGKNNDDLRLTTPEAIAVLTRNPSLENLSTEDKILIHHHNFRAMQEQATVLTDLPHTVRAQTFAEWVGVATGAYEKLPQSRVATDNPGFLRVWEKFLN